MSDPSVFLKTEFISYKLLIRPSIIDHQTAGDNCFYPREGLIRVKLWAITTAPPVYSQYAMNPERHRRYGEGVFFLTVYDFEKRGIEVDHITEYRLDFQKVWVVPAQFCDSWFKTRGAL